MIPFLFLLGLLSFTFGVYATYSETLRPYVTYIGVFCSIVSTVCWFEVVKIAKEGEKIFLLGMYWDALTIVPLIFMPVIVAGVNLTLTQWAGIGFVVLGVLLTRF